MLIGIEFMINNISNCSELPLVSVGVFTYRRPESLRRTLESLVNQTYQNLEIIVSDNASPGDETEKVMQYFLNRDSRIKYFRQSTNIGPYLNAQFVLDKAIGEYFMWSSDDDWHELECIAELQKAISADSSAVTSFAYFDIRTETGEQVFGYPDPSLALKKMAGEREIQRQLDFYLLRDGHSIPHVFYGLIRRKILSGFNLVQFIKRYGTYGSDSLLVFWLLKQGKVALVEKVLFGFTFGNVKHYTYSEASSYLLRRLSVFFQQCRYIASFALLATGITRLFVLFFLPWKFLEISTLLLISPFKRILIKFEG